MTNKTNKKMHVTQPEDKVIEQEVTNISPENVVKERIFEISESNANSVLQQLVEIPWKLSNPIIQLFQSGLKLQE